MIVHLSLCDMGVLLTERYQIKSDKSRNNTPYVWPFDDDFLGRRTKSLRILIPFVGGRYWSKGYQKIPENKNIMHSYS